MSLKFIVSAFATLAFVAVLAAPPALAQSRSAPDGSSAAPASKGAPRIREEFQCSTLDQVRILTEDEVQVTRSTAFTTLTGVTVTISGAHNHCIKVLFTANTICRKSAAGDFCYVRALHQENGGTPEPMHPDGQSFQAIASEASAPQSHTFKWITFVEGPNEQHTLSIQWRVKNSATVFRINDWTMDVEVTDTPNNPQ
jgi:hypothetical protein